MSEFGGANVTFERFNARMDFHMDGQVGSPRKGLDTDVALVFLYFRGFSLLDVCFYYFGIPIHCGLILTHNI